MDLTLADKFMVLTYFVIISAAIFNLILLQLVEQKKSSLVERIHRATEFSIFFVIPSIYLAFFLLVI